MSDIELFHFEDAPVRVVEHKGESWFVAADVCHVLGLTDVTSALRRLDDDEKAQVTPSPHNKRGGPPAQPMNIINEPGLYALIGRSRKAAAKRFDRWVRWEVLPSIRKTGGYGETDDRLNRVLGAVERQAEANERLVGLLTTLIERGTPTPALDPWTSGPVKVYDVTPTKKGYTGLWLTPGEVEVGDIIVGRLVTDDATYPERKWKITYHLAKDNPYRPGLNWYRAEFDATSNQEQ